MTAMPAAETVLWLLRHPQPEAAAEGRCYGSRDWKLSETGVRQAHAVAASLAAQPLAAIYTSPRQRCREAARILADVDTGNHDAAAEVDSAGARPSERLNFGGIAGGDDAFAAHRQRLDVGMRGIAGENLAVEENRVWSRLLRGQRRDGCRARHEARHDQEHSSG